MTEYRNSILSIFNHLPVLILEGLLIYGATLMGTYIWIWLSITGVVLLVTLLAIVFDSNRVYLINQDSIVIKLGKKRFKEYYYDNITTLKIRKHTIEMRFKDPEKDKVKTVYMGWYIKKFSVMKEELLSKIEQSENYENIIYINRW